MVNTDMATLTIRNIPDQQHAALRVRAAKHGRSMEEEVRVMIAEAVANENQSEDAVRADIEARVAKAQAMVREMFGGELPKGRVDAFIAERRAAAERGE
jgi:plasmid stability protein